MIEIKVLNDALMLGINTGSDNVFMSLFILEFLLFSDKVLLE